MVNKVILIGALGSDPEVKTTRADESMARMRVATNRRVQRDGKWEDETEWHTVVAFGRLADFAGKYLKKGRQIYVEGRLHTRKYTDKQNLERWVTEIVCEKIQMLGRKDEGAAPSAAPSPATQRNAPASAPTYDDDVPF